MRRKKPLSLFVFPFIIFFLYLVVFIALKSALQAHLPKSQKPSNPKEAVQHNVQLDKLDNKIDITPYKGWEMLWHDEFSDDSIDLTKWNVVDWAATKNNELQYYSPGNIKLEKGYLRLISENAPLGGRSYTSGAVETRGKMELLYGKIEIRARLPKGQGLFPALWLLSDNPRSLPEIDIMEMLGHKPNEIWMVYHWIDKDGKQKRAYDIQQGSDYTKAFHIYGLEWTPTKISWYIDGHEVFNTAIDIPDTPMYFYMNTAIGGDWPGSPDKTTQFPQYFDIDYVRIFKPTN